MVTAPQPDCHPQPIQLPIRPLPAVLMLVGLALTLALDRCVHAPFGLDGALPICLRVLTGLVEGAAPFW